MLDIGTWLGEYLKGTLAASWTDGVVLAVCAVLILASCCAWKGWPRWQKFVEYAPGLMTSLGIFGTFVGIVVGLMNFDINLNAIDKSIVHLLDGLKTAFITSVAGLIGAITFHFLDATVFEPRRQGKSETHTATPDDIHGVMKEQLEVMRSMHKSLAGSEEGSLVGQIKLLKADVNEFRTVVQRDSRDFREALFIELNRFAEMLAESATKQVIEALEQVVKDFNKNLTEQFGENFKALDASVKKMVDWQLEYKAQIETMSDQYRQSVDSLIETKTAVAGIWEECKEIPLAMAELRNVLEVNQHQIRTLQEHLAAFAAMRDRAVEAVPTIHARLEEIGDRLVDGSNRMHVVLLEGATEFQASVNATNAAMTGMATAVGAEAERLSTYVGDAATGFSNSARDSLARMEESSKSVHESLMRAANDVSVHGENMREAMSAGITTVHAGVDRIGERMATHERNLVAQMEESVKSLEGGVAKMADEVYAHADQLRRQFSGVIVEYQSEISRVIQSFHAFGTQVETDAQRVHEQVAQQLRAGAEKAMGGVVANMEAAAKTTQEAINAQLEAMDEARRRELNRVLSDMGSALTSITRRFADDYGRFASYMSDIHKLTQPAMTQ